MIRIISTVVRTYHLSKRPSISAEKEKDRICEEKKKTKFLYIKFLSLILDFSFFRVFFKFFESLIDSF